MLLAVWFIRNGFVCFLSFINCSLSLSFEQFFTGKVHGSLARAGKVRGQTKKEPKQEKSKAVTGRAKKRALYNKRFVTKIHKVGRVPGPNSMAARMEAQQKKKQ